MEKINNFILNLEFSFKTEEEKKKIISEKIDYILSICYGNLESGIQTKLFIFNFLYKYYNKTKNNSKELIDSVIEDKYNNLKKEITNSKEDNIDLCYRKDELDYLDKIKTILNLNKEEFNNFKYSLINYRFIVNLAVDYDTKKQLNKNKLDELYSIENRDKLKKAFEISVEHYKSSVYREETYKKGTENYTNYNGMLTTITSLQKRVCSINPKWLLKQTEKIKEILTDIIHKGELPNNEKINSFLYFELKYKKGYFIKVLKDIKLNLVNEEPDINKINYYIKFLDSLEYYYDNVFYLTYDLMNKNTQETKLTDYLNNKILIPQYRSELFNLGIKEIIQEHKDIINNITLQNKLKEKTLKPTPNTTLKRNIKKVIKIETYSHDNITLRIKTIKTLLTKLMLDNLSVYNIFYELNEELDDELNNNLKSNTNTEIINIQRNNLINLQNEVKDLYDSIHYDKNNIIKDIIEDLDENRTNKDFFINYQNMEKLIIYGCYYKNELIIIFDSIINNYINDIENYKRNNQLTRKEINEDELKVIKSIKNETLIELKIYTKYSYDKLRDTTIKFLKFISYHEKEEKNKKTNKETKTYTKRINYTRSFIDTLIRYNKADLNNIKKDINNKLKQEKNKNVKNYQDLMRIISVLTKQEKSFKDNFYDIGYYHSKDSDGNICVASDKLDYLVFWLIRKDRMTNYEFSKDYNELPTKIHKTLSIAYHKTLRKYITNKPWYIKDLDLAKRMLNDTMKDIITKKHLTNKYNFEQENELIKKALYFLLKEKNITLNTQTEIKKFLLLETKFDINRMTKIFKETRNEFENKLKFCNKTNTTQYANYFDIITTLDKLEKELKESFVSLNLEKTKRNNLINGCIEFLLDNKKDKDPEQIQNAEQFLLYNIRHHRETVESIFIKLAFKFKDNEILSSKLSYLQKRLLGRMGF